MLTIQLWALWGELKKKGLRRCPGKVRVMHNLSWSKPHPEKAPSRTSPAQKSPTQGKPLQTLSFYFPIPFHFCNPTA